MRAYNPRRTLIGFAVALLLVLGDVQSVSAKKGAKKNRNKATSQDREYWAKRTECEPIVQRDATCGTAIQKENCILKCVSDACYADVYGDDPLEDGEVDNVRGKSFRSCVKKEIKERDAKVAQVEAEMKTQKAVS
uniref:Uncharacterized protein n=1 Tax=Pyramimonas obovata TaxID=1411642 RepID=A0A7S0RAH5_9CHLO|mmetsp:Transcript_29689/g.64832  ORF Transcript_29689/g.64832 Transcript_29689/m.64832 type:complete len:135 (+) Transcript_29689:165-569(+)